MRGTRMKLRLRRRRWTRGVAMTEFLVGIPMIILMFAGIDYFRTAYARRLETLNQSHEAAWELAYSNDGSCYHGQAYGGWNDTNALGNMPDGNGDGQSLDKKFSSSMFMYGMAKSTKTMSITSSRWSATVGSSTTITCDEVVPKDDQDVLTPLVDFIKSFI